MLRVTIAATVLMSFAVPVISQEEKPARKKKGEPTSEIELGTIKHEESPKTWTFEIPKGTKRVEATIMQPGDDGKATISLNVRYDGHLKANGQDVLKFLRKNQDGSYWIKNFNNGKELNTKTDAAAIDGQWVDISPLLKPGKNEITYGHYNKSPLGVKVRMFNR